MLNKQYGLGPYQPESARAPAECCANNSTFTCVEMDTGSWEFQCADYNGYLQLAQKYLINWLTEL